MKTMNLKENKGLVHLDQPKYLFNILLFHYFLSDYLKKEEKEENEMSVWPNLYIDQGGTSQPLSPLYLNPTTNMLFHALSYRILENPILDFLRPPRIRNRVRDPHREVEWIISSPLHLCVLLSYTIHNARVQDPYPVGRCSVNTLL